MGCRRVGIGMRAVLVLASHRAHASRREDLEAERIAAVTRFSSMIRSIH